MLMNFQSALMKPYFDAGLKSLAEICGYAVASIIDIRGLRDWKRITCSR